MFQYRMKDLFDMGVLTQDILGDDAELAAMASGSFASPSPLGTPLPPSGAEKEVIILETQSSPSPSLLRPPPPAIPLVRQGPPPSSSFDPFEDDAGALVSIGEAMLPIEKNWKPQSLDL